MNAPVHADNCQACGQEFLSTELIPVKLGSYYVPRIRICLGCLVQGDIYEDYREAAELILDTKAANSK